MKKRSFLQSAALLAAASTFSLAQAQTLTPIKFQLDWRFEGPSALFLQPVAKGTFKAAGLDVAVDAGNGSGGAVQRVASGTYDMGFADLAARRRASYVDLASDTNLAELMFAELRRRRVVG